MKKAYKATHQPKFLADREDAKHAARATVEAAAMA